MINVFYVRLLLCVDYCTRVTIYSCFVICRVNALHDGRAANEDDVLLDCVFSDWVFVYITISVNVVELSNQTSVCLEFRQLPRFVL